MLVVCAWCGKTISGDGQGPVSHGICPSCAFSVEHAFHKSMARRGRVRAIPGRKQAQHGATIPLPGFGRLLHSTPESAAG